MIIYNIQYLLRLYLYLHYFYGVYVALSFLRYIIQNFYNGSLYILSYFINEQGQIEDKSFIIEEIENDFIIIK